MAACKKKPRARCGDWNSGVARIGQEKPRLGSGGEIDGTTNEGKLRVPRHAPQARMVGARWQCYLSSATGLSNSPPLARGRAAGGLVGTIWAGPLFIPRQKRAVIALAKAPQCAGGKVTVAERANFTI